MFRLSTYAANSVFKNNQQYLSPESKNRDRNIPINQDLLPIRSLFYLSKCGQLKTIASLTRCISGILQNRLNLQKKEKASKIERQISNIELSYFSKGVKTFMSFKRMFILCPLILLVITFTNCGNSPEAARKKLAQLKIDFNQDAFADCVINSDMVAVDLFLAAGMNPNVTVYKDYTVLMSAAQQGNTQIARSLLNKGANINTQDGYGKTPLIYAVEGGHIDTVKELLKHNAQVNVKSKNDFTPLMYAAKNGNIEIVRALINKGADVNAKVLPSKKDFDPMTQENLDKVTPHTIEEIFYIVDHPYEGYTALIFAAENDHTEIVRVLLVKGADVNAKSYSHKTALLFATEQHHNDIVRLLKQAGAKE